MVCAIMSEHFFNRSEVIRSLTHKFQGADRRVGEVSQTAFLDRYRELEGPSLLADQRTTDEGEVAL